MGGGGPAGDGFGELAFQNARMLSIHSSIVSILPPYILGDSNTLHVGRAAGHAVHEELQEDLVKAAGFIVGGSRKTGKTGPSIGASPEKPGTRYSARLDSRARLRFA